MVDILSGMVIMSIIIAMVFYLFTALNGQVFNYGKVHNQLNEYLMMRMDISKKCDMADEITATPNGFRLTNDLEEFTYIISEGNLLRMSQQSVDTLSTELLEYKLKYSEKNKEENKELVSEIELMVGIQEQALTCHFYKSYDLRAEMNLELLNEF